MTGKYFGGGSIDHVVSDGKIYLDARDMVDLLTQSGIELADYGLNNDNEMICEQGRTMMVLAYKINELTSELVTREILKSL